MESETPADVRIFFKDKQNELKGPYTEREIQEWYRQNWFESSFPFYFMTGDEKPTEQTEFLTLDTLRTLNGIGCPFAPIKPESSNEKIDEKIAKLEKDFADLSKKCDGMKEMEKLLEEMEKRLKELSTQPPPTSSSSAAVTAPVAAKAAPVTTAAKKPKKKPKEKGEHDKWANEWAAYYLDLLDSYSTGNKEKVRGKRATDMVSLYHNKISQSEPARLKCRDVLEEKLKGLEYFYCDSGCDAVFMTYEQILVHCADQVHREDANQHEVPTKFFNTTVYALIGSHMASLASKEEASVEKLGDTPLDPVPSGLCPQPFFVEHLMRTYAHALLASSVHSTRAQIVANMMPRLKSIMGARMMAELHEHIGDRQTYCKSCDRATGSREEYYKHLRSHYHLCQENAFDLITLVVNMYQKN